MRRIVVAENSMAGDGINAVAVTVEILPQQHPLTVTIALRMKLAALAAKSRRNPLRANLILT
jgi:hypothetical protein